jgi:2-oxoisovalerate dehydrogenase E1 component
MTATCEKPQIDLAKALRAMALSRECDRRESILFRQGKGYFQMPAAGHECVAALAPCLQPGDYVYPYYRDRALLLAIGTPLSEIALSYFAKRDSSSQGRQMASHFSDRRNNVVSVASPVGLQCLPAAGTAWAMRLCGVDAVTVCLLGDAACRQGEFYEAWCFAMQEQLPLVFVVEDNQYGISTRTEGMNPLRLGTLAGTIHTVDGGDPEAVYEAGYRAIARARAGDGPSILWMELDRLLSHASSDDHRVYRAAADIELMNARDPLSRLKDELMERGELAGDEWTVLSIEIAAEVDAAYQAAAGAPDPDAGSCTEHTFSAEPLPARRPGLPLDGQVTMAAAIQTTLRALLDEDPRVLIFGEDIEDPKGGVFGLTRGLSSAFAGRVRNAPLAEATIVGVAAGLALAGYRPIFELQFIDFVGPAFNQIVNQIATLRWRSAGSWKCPLVLYAVCGGYVPAGGPWHSQTNEAWFAHAPGLRIAVASTPGDAAGLLRAAAAGDDPVLLLFPKRLYRVSEPAVPEAPIRLGDATVRRRGDDVTLVAWGNCVRVALDAAASAQTEGISAEVLDLRSLVPCDWHSIRDSLRRTGRLVVIQEDALTCSVGQSILSEMARRPDTWDLFAAPPQLVSRGDVHIGFHPVLQRGVLPGVREALAAIRLTMRY